MSITLRGVTLFCTSLIVSFIGDSLFLVAISITPTGETLFCVTISVTLSGVTLFCVTLSISFRGVTSFFTSNVSSRFCSELLEFFTELTGNFSISNLLKWGTSNFWLTSFFDLFDKPLPSGNGKAATTFSLRNNSIAIVFVGLLATVAEIKLSPYFVNP